MSQEAEFNVLGCKVKIRPEQNDSHIAQAVVELVNAEILALKAARPGLRDTDVAVLVALKMATEKFQVEDEYKKNICQLEESLGMALEAIEASAN